MRLVGRWGTEGRGCRSGAVLGGGGGSECSWPIPPPSLGLHSASFAVSCALMAVASQDTRGELFGLSGDHKIMGGMRVDHPLPAPPLASDSSPNALTQPSPLPSSVSADIPGAVPEWLWWHLPNVLFTHGECDGPHLAAGYPGGGGGLGLEVREGERVREGPVAAEQMLVCVWNRIGGR